MGNFVTIGVGGQLFSGKDVVSDYLAHRLNELGTFGQWKRKGFASAVKKVFMDTFEVDIDFVEKWKRINEPPKGFDRPIRDCLILIGDGFRKMKADIWIELAFRNLTAHQIISDVRYINEAEYIKKQGGVTILMWRKGHENDLDNPSEQQLMVYVNKLKGKVEGVINDPSIPFDLFIANDGTVEDLKSKVDRLVVPYIQKKLGN